MPFLNKGIQRYLKTTLLKSMGENVLRTGKKTLGLTVETIGTITGKKQREGPNKSGPICQSFSLLYEKNSLDLK